MKSERCPFGLRGTHGEQATADDKCHSNNIAPPLQHTKHTHTPVRRTSPRIVGDGQHQNIPQTPGHPVCPGCRQVVVLSILLTSSTRKEVEFSELRELVRKRKGPGFPKNNELIITDMYLSVSRTLNVSSRSKHSPAAAISRPF